MGHAGSLQANETQIGEIRNSNQSDLPLVDGYTAGIESLPASFPQGQSPSHRRLGGSQDNSAVYVK